MLPRSSIIALAALFAAAAPAAAQSGLQVTPDGARTLVSKDVGGERWSIVRSADSVSGNVYYPDGADPSFVWCEELGAAEGEIDYACSGAERCTGSPCTPAQWSEIGQVALPESFFEPEDGGDGGDDALALRAVAAPQQETPGSGVQITPDGVSTLVNKDLEDERWSIARFADDEVVTGIVYRGEGAEPSFVWCEQTGSGGGNLELDCSGADSCRSGPCTPDQWTPLGEVTVPESFFQPPPEREITPDNAAQLELAWDFPLTSGVTAPPLVTDEFVYVGSWDAMLYALDPETGALRWSFPTGSGGFGIQGGVTLIPGSEDILFGDWVTNVFRLNGRTGELVWKVQVGDAAVDHIWSAVTVASGRIFVGIASHTDNPCTNGRTAALDLDTGELLWERQNVPERVCRTDTAIACEDSSDCPENGECVEGRGAGVTASPAVSEDGEWVYVNAVGCYTFPSIGDSDSIMKLDAATGATEWLNRVQPPEQFGFCAQDTATDCGTDAMCDGTGPCQEKGAYHDFGFLNGPLLLDVPDERGRLRKLLVSGSKDGTLYAFEEDTGEIAWTNEVLPTPVSPGFAGFGLFNGAIAYENGRIYAALFEMIPRANPAPPHLMAFDVRDGSTVWEDEIGRAYAHVGVKNDVLFTGTNDVPDYFVYDAATGERLKTFQLPAPTSSRTAIKGDTAYVGYGIVSSVGGVRAYRLP
ncbi:MAG: PQQ-binding-like beta-propeller repeat protein [Thermodesulfobacteriota bacterium]